MFCKECGKEIANGARFCDGCGTKIDTETNEDNSINNSRKMPPGTNSSGNATQNPKKKKGCLVAVIAFIIIMVIFVAIGSGNSGTSSQSDTGSSTSNKNIDDTSFVDVAGITAEQETAVIDILSQCGINNIKDIVHYEEGDSGDIKCYILSNEYDSKGVTILYLNNGTVGGITFNDEAIYKDGVAVTTPNDIINRPDLEVLSTSSENDGFFGYITGEIRNNTNKTYSYAQVTINLYNGETQIGSTLDNINNFEPGTVWKFKALVTDQATTSYKIVEVTGF